jgi:hypothetical protein
MLLPALGRAKERAKRIQCVNNLKQCAIAMHIYASDYRDKLPSWSGVGNWVWDMPQTVADMLVNSGTQRHVMYDPGFPAQDSDELWNFALNRANPALGFRVIGYSVTFPGTATLSLTNENFSLIPTSIQYQQVTMPPPASSDRVLMACATISRPGQANVSNRSANTYIGIQGGWSKLHQSAHLTGRLPTGGNVVMIDGHGEWRKFPVMVPRTDPGSGSPVFWW